MIMTEIRSAIEKTAADIALEEIAAEDIVLEETAVYEIAVRRSLVCCGIRNQAYRYYAEGSI